MSDNAMTCCNTDSTACCNTKVNLRTVRPAVDVVERDDAWLLVADLPGVVQDTIDLTVEGGELRLSASQQADDRSEDGFVLHD